MRATSRWGGTVVTLVIASAVVGGAGFDASADPGSPIVFPSGQERALLAAVEPFEMSGVVAEGWTLSGLQVRRTSVHYIVRRGEEEAALVVALDGTVTPKGVPGHTVATDARAAAATRALRDAFLRRADAGFWADVVEVTRDSASAPGGAIGPRGTERWLWRLAALLALAGAAGLAWHWRSRHLGQSVAK